MESSYDFLYENELSKQYTTSEKMYNAKGNFYTDIGRILPNMKMRQTGLMECTHKAGSDDGDSAVCHVTKSITKKQTLLPIVIS